MTHIPQNSIPIFEAGIYLPILLTIVNHDIDTINHGNFKLKGPYLHLLEETRIQLEKDLEKAKRLFKQRKMKLKRGIKDPMFTEYYFYVEEVVELRRYSNIRLRNQSEYLFEQYLNKQPLNFASQTV